jgi:hypothetical protein
VRISKSINVKDVDIGGCKQEVLQEAGKNMPWIQKKNADTKVKTVCRCRRDYQLTEDVICKELFEVKSIMEFFSDRFESDPDCRKNKISDIQSVDGLV